jgi:hypothetical protein
MAIRKLEGAIAVPSPRGEGQDEGGLKKQIAFLSR